MTNRPEDAAEALQSVGALRRRTRNARSGRWFVATVFGVLTMASAPLYWISPPSATTPGCRGASNLAVLCVSRPAAAPLGGIFNPEILSLGLRRWITLYWVVAIVAGLGAIVAYYRLRAKAVGVQGRVWPLVVVTGGLVALALALSSWLRPSLVSYLSIRGTAPLLLLALGVGVLAGLERSVPLVLFASGFFALALLSCLYDEVNLFQQIRLASLFGGGANQLPNLILPGLYLLLGGAGFRLADRRGRQAAPISRIAAP